MRYASRRAWRVQRETKRVACGERGAGLQTGISRSAPGASSLFPPPSSLLPPSFSSSRAATLIELLVAIVILSIGLLPLLLALNNVYVNTVKMGSRAEAQRLAADRIDELKALGFKEVETDLLAGAASVMIDEGALEENPYRRRTEIVHQRQVTTAQFVDAVAADLPTDYIRLTATVDWTTETGVQGRSLTALMTRDGALE